MGREGEGRKGGRLEVVEGDFSPSSWRREGIGGGPCVHRVLCVRVGRPGGRGRGRTGDGDPCTAHEEGSRHDKVENTGVLQVRWKHVGEGGEGERE